MSHDAKVRSYFCRDEHSHEAEALLHELLLQRLRQSSAGDSNTASGGRAAGSGPEVRQPGGSGTAVGSAEATLALALQAGGHRRQHTANQPQPGSSNGSGGPSGGTLVGSAEGAPAAAAVRQARPEIQPAERPRQRRPSTPVAGQAPQRVQRQQHGAPEPPAAPAAELRHPRLRPVAAPHLPLPLQQLQEAALSGGSGNNTPLSARSVESAWSDSGGQSGGVDSLDECLACHVACSLSASLALVSAQDCGSQHVPIWHAAAPAAPAVAELAPTAHKKKRGALHKLGKMLRGTKPAAGAAAYAQAPPQRGRPNPAALTAPLEHSMREKEAAALQAQLLQEQAAAGQEWHEQPAAVERWHEQQAAEPEPAAVPAAIRQPMQRGGQPQWQPQDVPAFTLQQQQQHAEHAQQLGWQQPAAWPQQQQREQQLAAGLPRSPFQSPTRGPLQEVPVPQQARPPRPSSGLSECPASPEAGLYYYPDAAAAGYAAAMAELQAQGLGPAPGGGDASRQESWQLRRLHVVHSNGLYSPK